MPAPGTWDAACCRRPHAGIDLVTAVVNGASSPPTTVYVHQHIDSLKVVPGRISLPNTNLLFARTNLDLQDLNLPTAKRRAPTSPARLASSPGPPPTLTCPAAPILSCPNNKRLNEILCQPRHHQSLCRRIGNRLHSAHHLPDSSARGPRLTGILSVNNTTSFPIMLCLSTRSGYTLAKPPLTWNTHRLRSCGFQLLYQFDRNQ